MFSGPAIEAVFSHSRGIPRLINTICQNALLTCYAKHAATITSEIIDGVAHDLRLAVVIVDQDSSTARLLKEQEQSELLQAIKTLLDVRDRINQGATKSRPL